MLPRWIALRHQDVKHVAAYETRRRPHRRSTGLMRKTSRSTAHCPKDLCAEAIGGTKETAFFPPPNVDAPDGRLLPQVVQVENAGTALRGYKPAEMSILFLLEILQNADYHTSLCETRSPLQRSVYQHLVTS